MSTWALIAVAVGLAMDAFAVSIGCGLTTGGASHRQTLRLAWHFGFFQAFMPVLGWLAGRSVVAWIAPVDHWVAFALLAGIGGKMVWEAVREGDEAAACPPRDPTRGWSLVLLSVATSIDALAVGLSLAVLGISIWYPALVIGVVCAAFTALGMRLGARFGLWLGRRMEVLGGLVLIAIGVRIVVEHLTG